MIGEVTGLTFLFYFVNMIYFPGLCLAGAWIFILLTLGRSLLNSVFIVFLVLKNTLVKKRISFWSIQTRIYSIPNKNKPGRVILLAQMPPVLLSVFRRGKNLSNSNMSWFYFARGIGASIKSLFFVKLLFTVTAHFIQGLFGLSEPFKAKFIE